MNEQGSIPKPHFVMISEGADELPIKAFEHAIFESPQKYLDIFSELGKITSSNTLQLEDGREAPIDGDSLARANQLFKFFKEGFDQKVFFDEPTEEQLLENDEHRKLVANLAKSLSRTRKVGGFNVKEENVEAPELRDQIRLSRLRLFIQRVIAWQQTQSSEDEPDSDLRFIG